MLKNRHEVIAQFKEPIYHSHKIYNFLNTFSCLENWEKNITIEFPRMKIQIHSVDYMEQLPDSTSNTFNDKLRFQQNVYRLWYQIDGFGVLQNVTRKSFGSARPGLLGVMERGERHTYLHRKGNFTCFMINFSLFPSTHAKCYWNAGIEGKTVLEEEARINFEHYIYDFFRTLSHHTEMLGIASLSRLLDIIVILFKKKLILVEESRFPKNKAKSLVVKAKNFIDIHYNSLHHQQKLEKECGIDINYLNILFKRDMGITLYQYTTSVRMEHAKHLLETTGKSVTGIATMTGYPNSNSFSRAFRRCECCTPIEYRSRSRLNKK